MEQLFIRSVGETKTASDGRKYFAVEFAAGFGQRATPRNMWQQFKKDKKTNLPTKELYWERGTPEQAVEAMLSKTPILGRKVTHDVVPYKIEGNDQPITKYSTIVFADENEVSVFAASGHNIVDKETGEVLGKKKALLDSAPAEQSLDANKVEA